MTKSGNDLLVGGQIVMHFDSGEGGGDASAQEKTVPALGGDAPRVPDVLAVADLLNAATATRSLVSAGNSRRVPAD